MVKVQWQASSSCAMWTHPAVHHWRVHRGIRGETASSTFLHTHEKKNASCALRELLDLRHLQEAASSAFVDWKFRWQTRSHPARSWSGTHFGGVKGFARVCAHKISRIGNKKRPALGPPAMCVQGTYQTIQTCQEDACSPWMSRLKLCGCYGRGSAVQTAFASRPLVILSVCSHFQSREHRWAWLVSKRQGAIVVHRRMKNWQDGINK